MAGTVKQLAVKLGDKVAEGSVLLTLDAENAAGTEQDSPAPTSDAGQAASGEDAPAAKPAGSGDTAPAELARNAREAGAGIVSNGGQGFKSRRTGRRYRIRTRWLYGRVPGGRSRD